MKNEQTAEQIEKLADQIGLFIEYWGFKKIHGQIWTYIWLAKDPIHATVLVKRLQVSKALVSLAIKDLLHYNVIRIAGQGNGRKILLEPNPDIHSVITNVLRTREASMLEEISKECEKTGLLSEKDKNNLAINQKQFESLQQMIEIAKFSLNSIIENHLS